MVFKKLLIISLLLSGFCARSETAADYFHSAAQLYIFGEKQKAAARIAAGLQKFPDDAGLNQLAALIKKEEQQQNQQSKNDQQKNSQPSQEQQKQEQKSSQQQQQQAGNQSDEQKKEEQSSQSQQQKDEQQKQKQASASDDQKQQGKPGEEANANHVAGEMTPQQAERLLDAQKDNEKLLPVRPEANAAARQRPIRDW